MSAYFKNIADGITSTIKGMSLTMRHMLDARNRRLPGDIRSDGFFDREKGMVTIQYPLEVIPIPDNGRYRLNNEMDDCIVCDKCAKVCPVDCIDIEPIKAIEEVGRTSDGSPIRLYAAKFDIDMAKCCYCGLCTTVCPTECLTMTKTFDYSEVDVVDMVYHYANLSPEKAHEKKLLLEQFQKEKEIKKATASTNTETTAAKPVARPAFKPSQRPLTSVPEEMNEVTPIEPENKRAFRPVMKPKATDENDARKDLPKAIADGAPKRPVFKPTKRNSESHTETEATSVSAQEQTSDAARPAFRPGSPVQAQKFSAGHLPAFRSPQHAVPKSGSAVVKEATKAGVGKGAFRPGMKPKTAAPTVESTDKQDDAPVKPSFRPTIKPKPEQVENTPAVKARPVFKPTFKKPATEDASLASTQPLKTEGEEKLKFKPTAPKARDAEAARKEIEALPSFKLNTDIPAVATKAEESGVSSASLLGDKEDEAPAQKGSPSKPKPGFRPTMKPKP